jgi:tetratricopeptide (TPR) repeat protein
VTITKVKIYGSLSLLIVMAALIYRHADNAVQAKGSSYNNPVPEKWAFVRGCIYKDSKRMEEAEKEILLIQDYVSRRNALFDLYCSNNRRDKAIRMLEKELEKDPNSIQALVLAGESHTEKGEYAKAVEYLEKARSISPGNMIIYRTFALIYAKQKDYDRAVKYLEMSLKPDGTDDASRAYTYGQLADIYFEKKDYVEAEKNVEMALRLLPNEMNFRYRAGEIRKMMSLQGGNDNSSAESRGRERGL